MIARRYPFSESSDGLGIKVVQTATAGTLIHTGPTDSKILQEIWLWGVNTDSVTRKLTLEFGGVTSPDNLIELDLLPEDGPIQIIPGFVLRGSATAKLIRAFCASANVVSVYGYINQLNQV
jgi:hypothetical protein